MCAIFISKALRYSRLRVNEGSHSFIIRPRVYPQVELAIPAFTSQSQSITALWPVLISSPAEGRRLSSPGWLGEMVVFPPEDGHPSSISRGGRESYS